MCSVYYHYITLVPYLTSQQQAVQTAALLAQAQCSATQVTRLPYRV
jgi:hypothetical protein